LPAASGLSQSQIDSRGCSRGDKHINPSRFTLRGENMQTAQCDKKGRLELSQAVRSRYGEKFLVLEGRKQLILRPIPRDPLQDLREIGRLLKGKSVRELKDAIEQQAMEEVGG
jgi:hypothetical protein